MSDTGPLNDLLVHMMSAFKKKVVDRQLKLRESCVRVTCVADRNLTLRVHLIFGREMILISDALCCQKKKQKCLKIF